MGRYWVIMCAVGWLGQAAADGVRAVEDDLSYTQRWNRFADEVFALHQQRLKGREITTTTRVGGYYRQPAFYQETSYFDKSTGRRLSTLQRETAHPSHIHSMEVFIYDDHGRVMRDYSVLYLPRARNAPQHTLINLHAYHGELHAFRQFDAADERIYESCEGRYQGGPVEIHLDDMDIIRHQDDPQGIMFSEIYRVCFKGLPEKSAGKYLRPQ